LALPQLEDAVKGSPRNALFQYHLGTAYARAGQPAKARQALTRAIATDPAFSERAQAQAELDLLPKN
jgi:Flp pilus assembly protein TadD